MNEARKGAAHVHKLPFYCPHCSKITGTIDDRNLRELGICAECVVMYVESRTKLAIDLSKYAPRGGTFDGWLKEKIDEAFASSKK